MRRSQQNNEDLINQANKESEYFNKVYADMDEEHRINNYIVPEKFINQVINPKDSSLTGSDYAYSLLGKLEGKSLLDYGAGDGWNTICFAKAKAKVWAIEISEKGVDLIRKKIKANGVSDFVVADVQNCYNTQFESNKFDIIYGGGILHHLDVKTVALEISRILRPEGIAVFIEPIRETKIMDIIKSMVLKVTKRKADETTENETPLTSERIYSLRNNFKVVNYRYFEVLSSANKLINSERLNRLLLWADYVLMRFIPGFKKLGRTVVIELREPIK